MADPSLAPTRRALHAVAEYVLAAPQHAATGRIRLRVVPGGVATSAEPHRQVMGGSLVAGDLRMPIAGSTPLALAAAVGVRAATLTAVYPDGSGVGLDERLDVTPGIADVIATAHSIGDAALRALAPDAEPILWPEHFDVAIRIDDVNYGVSPGDGYLGEPYAYVGTAPVAGDNFWNAPFGAIRSMSELADADAVLAFFRDGQRRTSAPGA